MCPQPPLEPLIRSIDLLCQQLAYKVIPIPWTQSWFLILHHFRSYILILIDIFLILFKTFILCKSWSTSSKTTPTNSSLFSSSMWTNSWNSSCKTERLEQTELGQLCSLTPRLSYLLPHQFLIAWCPLDKCLLDGHVWHRLPCFLDIIRSFKNMIWISVSSSSNTPFVIFAYSLSCKFLLHLPIEKNQEETWDKDI